MGLRLNSSLKFHYLFCSRQSTLSFAVGKKKSHVFKTTYQKPDYPQCPSNRVGIESFASFVRAGELCFFSNCGAEPFAFSDRDCLLFSGGSLTSCLLGRVCLGNVTNSRIVKYSRCSQRFVS